MTALCTFTRHFDERPADLADQILVQSDNKQVRWPAWFALNGLSAPSHGVRFERSFLATAWDGLGVAPESTVLAEREIATCCLVAPLEGCSENIRYVGHHLVFPKALHQRKTLRLFIAWLTRQLKLNESGVG